MREACDRSLLVAELLGELERSDLIVYVTDSMPGVGSSTVSYLTFVSHDENARYVLIRLDFMKLSPPERIAWLGHELQHALEIAESPDVVDASGLATLYKKIGWETSDGRFESARARDMGVRSRSQLEPPRSAAWTRRALP